MILAENLSILKTYKCNFPEQINPLEPHHDAQDHSMNLGQVHMVKSMKGDATLKISSDAKDQYIHSKYDPISEAEKFVQSLHNVDEYKHLFFYGTGLGYHIEMLLKLYPNKKFTIYEPHPSVFHFFLANFNLKKLPVHQLQGIHVQEHNDHDATFINEFTSNMLSQVMFVTLPSYTRIFREEYDSFQKAFSQSIKNKHMSLRTSFAFEKLWTINSLHNLEHVLESPNINQDFEESVFKDKPVVLVGAGPSLAEEMERLKHIKENKLAYIFSVGSANKALVANGVYPDAVFTYDPQLHNDDVFREIIDRQIAEIPIIFGSSVGYTTLLKYPGQKIHMITSQDTVAPFYLRRQDGEKIQIIHDAPSIAALALQTLSTLGCNPVILVGHNLAYKNNQYYTHGIRYETRPTEMVEKDQKNLTETEGVDGGPVQTTPGWIKTREQMEQYVQHYYTRQEVINCTAGGAKIKGAPFKRLEDVMSELLEDTVDRLNVCSKQQSAYDFEFTIRQVQTMERNMQELAAILTKLRQHLDELEVLSYKPMEQKVSRTLSRFEKALKKLNRNEFFKVILQPMNRVQVELTTKNMNSIRFDKDLRTKTEKIVKHFKPFVHSCQSDFHKTRPVVEQVHKQMGIHLKRIQQTTEV